MAPRKSCAVPSENPAIKQIYFPPYSPELNPHEHVWEGGRSEVTHNRFIPKIEPVAKELAGYIEGARCYEVGAGFPFVENLSMKTFAKVQMYLGATVSQLLPNRLWAPSSSRSS